MTCIATGVGIRDRWSGLAPPWMTAHPSSVQAQTAGASVWRTNFCGSIPDNVVRTTKLQSLTHDARRRLAAVSLLLLACSAPDALMAQEPRPITLRDAPCEGCRIHVEPVIRLGSVDGAEAFHGNAVMELWSEGLAVHDAYAVGVIRQFDLEGNLVAAFGQAGEGPGEHRIVRHIRVGRGDTLSVYDSGRDVVNRFDPRGKFVDQIWVPPTVFDFVPIGGDRLLVSGIVQTRHAAGFPLHVVRDGTIERSFGNDGTYMPASFDRRLVRSLGQSTQGSIWAAHQMQYTLERWDTAGSLKQVFTRDVPWFGPWDGIETPPNARPPAPLIRGVHEDVDGLLWVFIGVADLNWRPVPFQRSPTGALMPAARAEYDDLYDLIIEVIDPRRGEVIAHTRGTRDFKAMRGGLLFSYEDEPSGVPYYRIWQPRLIRQPPGGPSDA